MCGAIPMNRRFFCEICDILFAKNIIVVVTVAVVVLVARKSHAGAQALHSLQALQKPTNLHTLTTCRKPIQRMF